MQNTNELNAKPEGVKQEELELNEAELNEIVGGAGVAGRVPFKCQKCAYRSMSRENHCGLPMMPIPMP